MINKQVVNYCDLCKHAPVAIVGPNQKTIGNGHGSYGMLSASSVGDPPSGRWEEELTFIKEKLAKYKIEVLTKRFVKEPLSFETKIRTVVTNEGYRVFDALFYWED
ncbi:hypothetical protein [Gorillibacterium sp. CAU 1737]|uniref:hypothetical protein n=1 Tax=Gorillibacterium sp. CAU 1737 TaxID=3140362 RepID=UPI0032613F95